MIVVIVHLHVLSVERVVNVLFDVDVPIRFVLDHGRGCLGDVVEGPGLDTLGLGVVDGPRRIEELGVPRYEAKIGLKGMSKAGWMRRETSVP